MNAFHIHTYRCRHAGNEKEMDYIQKCCELGVKRVVFTDHAPFPGNPFRGRMSMAELDDYVSKLTELRRTYKDKIEIVIGLEAEYLPSFDAYYADLKDEYGIEFLLLGQHFAVLPDGSYTFQSKDRSNEASALTLGMIAGMRTGYFDAVAHPDQIFRRVKTWTENEERIATAIKECAAATGVVLEQNISNMRGNKKLRSYRPEFWQDLKGSSYLYGLDAHSVQELEENYKIRQFLISNHLLTKKEVLYLYDEPILIQHATKGLFVSHADAVYTLGPADELHLSDSDMWLDCSEYGHVWTAYRQLTKK